MNLLMGLGRLERVAFIFFSLFAILQCLSIAIANIALGIAVFFIVLHILLSIKKGGDETLLSERIKKNKTLLLLLILFWGFIFLSALFSGDPQRGLRIFFGQFIYRTFPLLIVLLFFPKPKYAVFLLFLSLLSSVLDVMGGICLHGFSARLKGLYGHPMTLAGFLVISIPIIYCCLLDWKKSGSRILFCACFFIISFTGLLMNSTRGAWIALAITLPLITLLYDRSLKKIIFLVLFAGVTSLIFVSSPQLQNRAESITSTTLQSNTERILMWKSAYQMFKDHPVLGVGLGQYAKKYLNQYKSPEAKEQQNHSHNNLLQMLAENGFLGFLGFIFLFGYILCSSLKGAIKEHSVYSVLIFGSTTALLIQGLTEYNFGNSAVIKYYWTVLGCLLILQESQNVKSSSAAVKY